MTQTTKPAGYDDPIIDTEVCGVCGCELEYEDCGACGGDGAVDEYDEDPINEPPGSYVPCEQCDGKGGWLGCPNVDRHHLYLSGERKANT